MEVEGIPNMAKRKGKGKGKSNVTTDTATATETEVSNFLGEVTPRETDGEFIPPAGNREDALLPAVVTRTEHLHPDEIVVDEELNSRDTTGKVEDLAASLLSRGQEQPIRVRQVEGQGITVYHLVFGYRRHKAAQYINENGLADSEKWPDGFKLRAEVVECSDSAAFASNVVENAQRKDLTLIETCRAMDRLSAEFGWTQQEIADLFRCNRSTVSRNLKLLTAPKAAQKLVSAGKATAEVVLEILQRPEEEQKVAFEELQEEVTGGGKAKSLRQKKRTKRYKAEKAEGNGDEPATAGSTGSESTKLSRKEILLFWETTRDEELPEGADNTIQIVADWVVRHMEGKRGYGDRAMRSKLASLRMGS